MPRPTIAEDRERLRLLKRRAREQSPRYEAQRIALARILLVLAQDGIGAEEARAAFAWDMGRRGRGTLPPLSERTCARCGAAFRGTARAVYCSARCGREARAASSPPAASAAP